MDPDETLRIMRDRYRDVIALIDVSAETHSVDTGDLIAAAGELAEHAEALDGWLSKSGFRPADWQGSELGADATRALLGDEAEPWSTGFDRS